MHVERVVTPWGEANDGGVVDGGGVGGDGSGRVKGAATGVTRDSDVVSDERSRAEGAA